jgi:hypothetical protein
MIPLPETPEVFDGEFTAYAHRFLVEASKR